MNVIRLLSALLMGMLFSAGALAQQNLAAEDVYTYYYNAFDWHCSAQYAKLGFDHPIGTEYADILMFILNTHPIEDVSAQTAQEVVAGDPGLAVAYCCDALTGISRRQPHNRYRRVNLEDADYYDDETAARIRAIVRNGYRHDWTDEALRAAQRRANAWLDAQGMEGIENLTHGQAMTATQLAIWLRANAPRLTNAVYCGLHDYSRYDATTYDPEKVPSGVPSDQAEKQRLNEANARNVERFKNYLLSLEGDAAEAVIFTENRFVADSSMYASAPGLHNLTVRFTLAGTVSPQDSLTLTVRLGDMEKRYQLGKNATLSSDGAGYYAVSFEGVDAQQLRNGVEMTISGMQVLKDDAYFYEPLAAEGENARDVSQNLVGYQRAGTQTAVFAACTMEVNPEDVVIIGPALVPDTGDRGMTPYLIALAGALALIALLWAVRKGADKTDESRRNDGNT